MASNFFDLGRRSEDEAPETPLTDLSFTDCSSELERHFRGLPEELLPPDEDSWTGLERLTSKNQDPLDSWSNLALEAHPFDERGLLLTHDLSLETADDPFADPTPPVAAKDQFLETMPEVQLEVMTETRLGKRRFIG